MEPCVIKRGFARGSHKSPMALLSGALGGWQGTRGESYHLEDMERSLMAVTEGH